MNFDREAWKVQTLETIRAKTQAYTTADKENFRISTIAGLTEKNAALPVSNTEAEENSQLINNLISALPIAPSPKREDVLEFHKMFDAAIATFNQKYNLIRKGHYLKIWIPVGIALGLPWGVALDHIGLGLPIGLALGFFIGSYLDSKAKKEGRAI